MTHVDTEGNSLMRLALAPLILVLAACTQSNAGTDTTSEPQSTTDSRTATTPIQVDDSYYQAAAAQIDAKIQARGVRPAKNIILFIGDGMGISTITAGRIHAGQKRGNDGESYRLAMDTLPATALSKTYSHDFQVSDSASTATAITAGIKANSRTLGIRQTAPFGNCARQQGAGTDSLFELAEEAGLSTGIVSTARLTHATPASTFSESASRDWESDADLKGGDASDCHDIARQFIEWPAGDGFEIALGGGRSVFTPAAQADPESENRKGQRTDGRDLTVEWTEKSDQHVYVTDKAGFDAIDYTSSQRVLGLFEPSHMKFELDRIRDTTEEPSISEMTRAAITRLSQNESGYVLMVEGGRIDHGHHGVNAARALEDTDAFDQAISVALEMTDDEDTLIIVTADHSHTMTIAGYPRRNNPILGKSTLPVSGEFNKGIDNKPYTTLSYANGQSACRKDGEALDCSRQDLTDIDTTAPDFLQPAMVPLFSETHAGEDVAIFASGPGSELISGVMEQNEIFHVMARASGLVTAPETSNP